MKPFLSFLAFFYQLGTRFLRFLYEKKIKKKTSVPIFVISIGNITFGGSEKTPLSIKLTNLLIKKGFKPALLSRGYKGKWEKCGGELLPENIHTTDWKTTGDEPYMTARNIPRAGIFLGKDRISSSTKAFEKGYDVAVMDDGFQYFPLQKDLDIVLHQCSDKVPLREPLRSLKKAHLILLKKTSLENKISLKESLQLNIPVYEYSVMCRGFIKIGTEQLVPPEKLQQKKALAFCGIARPHRFLETLKEEGIYPESLLKFPDHYEYPVSSVNKIINKHKSLSSDILVTTEKDAVKLEQRDLLKNLPVYYSKIDLWIEKGFFETVFSKLSDPKK